MVEMVTDSGPHVYPNPSITIPIEIADRPFIVNLGNVTIGNQRALRIFAGEKEALRIYRGLKQIWAKDMNGSIPVEYPD
jgi:hypothetical protein